MLQNEDKGHLIKRSEGSGKYKEKETKKMDCSSYKGNTKSRERKVR